MDDTCEERSFGDGPSLQSDQIHFKSIAIQTNNDQTTTSLESPGLSPINTKRVSVVANSLYVFNNRQATELHEADDKTASCFALSCDDDQDDAYMQTPERHPFKRSLTPSTSASHSSRFSCWSESIQETFTAFTADVNHTHNSLNCSNRRNTSSTRKSELNASGKVHIHDANLRPGKNHSSTQSAYLRNCDQFPNDRLRSSPDILSELRRRYKCKIANKYSNRSTRNELCHSF